MPWAEGGTPLGGWGVRGGTGRNWAELHKRSGAAPRGAEGQRDTHGALVSRSHLFWRVFFFARFFAMNLTNLVAEMTLIAMDTPRTKSAKAAACS